MSIETGIALGNRSIDPIILQAAPAGLEEQQQRTEDQIAQVKACLAIVAGRPRDVPQPPPARSAS
jgi:hypothetical protein